MVDESKLARNYQIAGFHPQPIKDVGLALNVKWGAISTPVKL